MCATGWDWNNVAVAMKVGMVLGVIGGVEIICSCTATGNIVLYMYGSWKLESI